MDYSYFLWQAPWDVSLFAVLSDVGQTCQATFEEENESLLVHIDAIDEIVE
jgi:hypothetical protein